MSDIPVDSGTAPDYYNPAKDMDKLRAATKSPLPFDGWPSRWQRCLAAEVVEQAETIITLRGHLEIARAALTASAEREQEYRAALKDVWAFRDDESLDKLMQRRRRELNGETFAAGSLT